MQVRNRMEYYAWRVRGRPVEVRLNLPMLRYMVPWIRERNVHPREAFGILLGRIQRRWGRYIVIVDDFEPFDPAKLRGRPKAPPGTDLSVVGLYRRRAGDDLRLDGLDASFIQSSFVHPGMVYLLVAAAADRPDRAAFFIQERGEVHGYTNYGEFPFDSSALRGPAAGSRRSPRWITAAGLAACAIALAGWFWWLIHGSAAPVAIATPPPPQAQAQPAEHVVEQPAPQPAKPAPAREHRRAAKHRPAKKRRAR